MYLYFHDVAAGIAIALESLSTNSLTHMLLYLTTLVEPRIFGGRLNSGGLGAINDGQKFYFHRNKFI